MTKQQKGTTMQLLSYVASYLSLTLSLIALLLVVSLGTGN